MEENNRKRRPWLIVLLALLLLLPAAGGALARYITANRTQWQMISAGFHISSEILKETAPNPNPTAYGDPATGDFTVPLHNYEVENLAAISEVDITYYVDVTNGSLISVKNGDTVLSGTTEGTITSYILPKGTALVTHTLTVRPEDDTQPVTVTVNATAPFSKSLSASFTPSAGITVTLSERAEGGQLVTVHTNQYSGPLTLQWPNTLTPAAGVNEYLHDWQIGYYTATGPSTAYMSSVEKEHDYLFEFVAPNSISATVDDATGTVTFS